MRPLAVRAACLLVAGALAGLAVNVLHPRGVRFFGPAATAAPSACGLPPGGDGAAGAAAPAAGADAVEVLSVTQASGLCGDPRVLVADARGAAAFAEGHVSGAVHLPCAASQGVASAALGLLAGKDTLIVYGDATADALPVAEEMRRRLGARGAASAPARVRVAVLDGGFPAWSHAGLACSSGPCNECGGQEKPHR